MRGLTKVKQGNKMYTIPREIFSDPTRINGKKKPPEMMKDFQLSEVHEMHHEIARRLVIGCKPKEISKDLNIGIQTIRNVRKSPIIQEQMKLMGGARDKETKDVATQIKNLAPKAVQILSNVLEDEDNVCGKALQVKTSLAILDRAGHAVPKNVNVQGVHAVVTAADLAKIKERGAEIGIYEDGETIDV